MFIASWNFDLQFGVREEALRALRELEPSGQLGAAWKAKSSRILLGSIGAPESRVVIEHEFASLADLESTWAALQSKPDLFKKWVSTMKPLIVAGSPRWEIYRVMEQR